MKHPNVMISQLTWSGISIEIEYTPSFSDIFEKIYGYKLAHIVIKTVDPDKSPLPITKSGYLSHFCPSHFVDNEGSPNDFVIAWLEESAKSYQWINYEAEARQGQLF